MVSSSRAFALFLFSLTLLIPRGATAGGNPAGGCTEQTHAATCNRDGTNPCSGICLPDFSQDGGPLACLPPDTPLTMIPGHAPLPPGIEGFPCSPTGDVGSDCAHSCRSGACVATNAPANAACQPDGGANICSGGCDGNGSCVTVPMGGRAYSAQLNQCAFGACDPLSNPPVGNEAHVGFIVPAGTPCSNEEECEIDDACNAEGFCIGTQAPDCEVDYGDAGADDDGDDAEGDAPDAEPPVTDAGAKRDSGESGPATSGGGGCSVGGPGAVGFASMMPLLALLGLRRRASRAVDA